jgi:hypothetical protein
MRTWRAMGKEEIRRERAVRKRKMKRNMEIAVMIAAALTMLGTGYLLSAQSELGGPLATFRTD